MQPINLTEPITERDLDSRLALMHNISPESRAILKQVIREDGMIKPAEVEYRVMFRPTWSAVMLELHPLPDQPWRDRDHVTQSVSAIADVYTVHRRVDGGPWMLMVSVT